MCGFTGISVSVVCSCLFICIFPIIPTQAANPYKLGELDYFEDKATGIAKKADVFDWRDVVYNNNGSLDVYTPPAVVIDLLERPTIANARSYLKWQQEKVRKIIKAQQMIEQALKEDKP